MSTNKSNNKEAIEKIKEQAKQDQDEYILIEKKLNSILDYFKLLYISDITEGRSISGFKLLYGDLLLKKIFDDEKNKLISLNSTNYMLAQDLQIYTSKMLLTNKKVNNAYGDLDWTMEIINLIPANEKAIETIANFLPFDIYTEALEAYQELPMPKEKIMQKRINEVNKIMKAKENN